MDEQAVLLVIGARMPVSEKGARRLELAALVAEAARSLPGELPDGGAQDRRVTVRGLRHAAD